ncbi:hypothetical protein [Lishizhenia sp.]|uniref:hypothetical protein n=1 Tax=Lishizhenia sp. TaxID=2497594 RepID=UPI00299EF8B8|nr:hypothetical protein [Lishizhenia sp.]MDX1445048.1 hypothetical protein [Lishizhenia sp.]
MKIGFNGLPLFTKELTQKLKSFDLKNKYVFYNTYEELKSKIRLMLSVSTLDGFVSFKGVSENSKSLDLILKKNVPLIMYWHGTDVSLAIERAKKGTINWKYIKCAEHYSDAPWLIEELNSIGVKAHCLPFKSIGPAQEANVYDYKSIKVLSYIGHGREVFYGIKEVFKLASDYPDVEFTIVGTKNKFPEAPSNVTFLGWVIANKMEQLMKTHAVLLRLTEHDGNAQMIMEAKAMGMECIWTQPDDDVIYWKGEKNLNLCLKEAFKRVEERDGKSNVTLAEKSIKSYNSRHVIINFIETLKKNFDK